MSEGEENLPDAIFRPEKTSSACGGIPQKEEKVKIYV